MRAENLSPKGRGEIGGTNGGSRASLGSICGGFVVDLCFRAGVERIGGDRVRFRGSWLGDGQTVLETLEIRHHPVGRGLRVRHGN